jgi:hypothetical protein
LGHFKLKTQSEYWLLSQSTQIYHHDQAPARVGYRAFFIPDFQLLFSGSQERIDHEMNRLKSATASA